MFKKSMSFLLVLMFTVVLVGCNKDEMYDIYNVEKENNSKQFDFEGNITIPELTIDGIDNVSEWENSSEEITFGHNNNSTFKMYVGDKALFIFFNVKDTNIMTKGYNNGDDVTQSDSVEFYIDTENDGSPSPQDGDYQINIGAHGKARVLSGSGGSWGPWNGIIDYAIVVDGTINDDSDEDTSYTIELMLPFDQIGLQKEDVFGFSLGHIDKETSGTVPGEDFAWYGYTHNGQFSDPQNPSKYVIYLDGSYYTRDSVPLENIDFNGIATDDSGNALENVTVAIQGTTHSTTTNANGEYTFIDVDRNSDIVITAQKEGYINYTKTLIRDSLKEVEDYYHFSFSLIDSSTVQYTSISLNLTNILNSKVDNASISIEGTFITGTTNSEGYILLTEVPISSTISVLFEKEGYQSKTITLDTDHIIVGGETELGEIEVFLEPYETFYFAGNKGINGFSTEIVRGITGIHINFVTDTAFEANESIEFFIDTKESGSSRNTSDYRINFSGDGSVAILNWGDGTNNDVATSGIATTLTPSGDGVIIDAFIPYTFLETEPTEIIGISFGVWSGVVNDWDGWGYGGFIAPEIPSKYVRVGIDNTLYKSETNESVVTITGNVELEGVTITVGDISTTSDESGDYTLVVPESTSYSLNYSLIGYQTIIENILPSDFTSEFLTRNHTLVKYNNSLSGTINEDDVTITVKSENITTTSTQGSYLLENLSTDHELVIIYEKDGFVTVTINLTVEELNGSTITKDINMVSATSVGTFSGTVSSYEGFLENVTLNLVGTEISTTTNSLGEFTFENITLDNYKILVHLEGYEDKEYLVSADEYSNTYNIVLTKTPGTTGVFSGKDTHVAFDPIEGQVVRETEGFRFTFTTTGEFAFDGTNKEVIELFIDTGLSGTARDKSDYLFMLRSDGTIGIVNWEGGGNEDTSTIVFTNSAQLMEVYIPYTFLGVTTDDIIGISLGQWNDFATDWDGWTYNGKFVAPENPQAYIRIGTDNQLYDAPNNEIITPVTPGTTGVFSGKDTHVAFDPIEGQVVRETEGFRFTFTTTEEFAFDGTNKEVIELFIDTGLSGTARDKSDYLFMLRSDGTIGIVNWEGGGNEDTSTIVFTNSAQLMEVYIPYTFLGVTTDDIIGISLGQWNDFATDWDGWTYNGKFVAPENPQAYIRIGTDNQLYEGNSN